MGRSELGLISWSSHLPSEVSPSVVIRGLILDSYHGPHTFHPRCLRLLSWDGLNLDSYHGPYTFSWGVSCLSSWDGLNSHLPSEVSPPVVMRRSELGLIWWSSHLPFEVSPPIVMRLSKLGLIWWSSHLPSEVSLPVIMRRFELGLISWPSHLLLRCLRLSSWGGHILLHRGCLQWLQDSLPPCGLERDHCHWSHRKRELRCTLRNLQSHFLCLELLCLSAW